MAVKQGLRAALLLGLAALSGGCTSMPDRLDSLADAGRDFAVVHPIVTRSALMAARAALRKPQHLRVVCDAHCLVRE